MRTVRFAVFAALLLVAAVQTFAAPCGYNPVIVASDTVESLSTGNQASFTANTNPAFIDWTITNGTFTFEASTVTFTAARRGTIQLHLTVGNGQNCADEAFKSIEIVHPCIITNLSRAVSESYVGGTTPLDVEADCEWDVVLPGQPAWVRVVGPTTFNGDGTVSFEFDPLPFDNSSQSASGRTTLVYVGDKDISLHQAGWGTVGTDIIRDGNADLLWRNISNGITWMQPMTGLTPGAGATVGGASAPFFPEPDWRIVTTRTERNVWKIYWRNFAAWDNMEQPFAGTGAGTPTLMNHDDDNWRVAGAGIFSGSGATEAILRRNLATGSVRITRPTYDSTVWVEPDANWRILAVEDFDGDGNNDILWRHAVSGICFMILEPGGEMVAQVFHYEPDLNWQIVAAGDVNADGRADIVWRNSADGRVWIQAMDGFRSIASNVVWTDADPNWRINGVADFDGNGSKDLLWRNSSTGLVFGILLNESLNVLSSGVIHNEPNLDWKIVAPNTAEAAVNGNH